MFYKLTAHGGNLEYQASCARIYGKKVENWVNIQARVPRCMFIRDAHSSEAEEGHVDMNDACLPSHLSIQRLTL